MRPDLWIHRKGGALMRVRVALLRRPIRGVAARMRAAGLPPWTIAARLDVPRNVVDRALGPDRSTTTWREIVRAVERELAA